MQNAFLSLMKPPLFERDEEKTRVAKTLHIVLLSIAAGAAVFAFVAFFVTSNPGRYVLLLTPFILVLLGLLASLHHGHIYWAGGGLALTGWLLITIAGVTGDGIRSPGNSGYIIFACIAGLLVKKRLAIFYALLSVAAGYFMVILKSSGLTPPAGTNLSDFAVWVIFSIIICVATLLIILVRYQLDQVLAQAHTEIARRQQMETRLREQNTYFATLHQVSLGLINQFTIHDLLNTITAEAHDLLGAAYSYIEMFNEEETEAVTRVAMGGMFNVNLRREIERGIGGVVWSTGKSFAVDDYGRWSKRIDNPPYELIHGAAAAPLKVGDKVIGILGVTRTQPDLPFTPEQVEMLERLAEMGSLALYNARLFEQTQNEIAERKRAEEEIKRSQANLLALIESANDSIWSVDENFRLITFNSFFKERFQKIFGKPPVEGIGIDDRFTPAQAAFWQETYSRALRGQRFSLERELRLEGKIRHEELSFNPITANDRITGIVVFAKDITERKRLAMRLHEQNDYLTALHQVTLGLINRLDTDELLQAIVAAGHTLLETQYGYLGLIVNNDTEVETRVVMGEEVKNIVGTRRKLDRGIDTVVWRTGKLFALEDYNVWEGRRSESTFNNLHAIASAPLKSGERVIGVLGFSYTKKERKFSPEQIEILDRFGELASLAIYNAQLFEKAQNEIAERKKTEDVLTKRVRELATVAEVSTAASTILQPQQLLQAVVELTEENFHLYHIQIYLLHDAGDSLRLAAAAGEASQQMLSQSWSIPLNHPHSLIARTARTRVSAVTHDVLQEGEYLPNPLLPNTRSEVALPMLVGNDLLGVFDLQSDRTGDFTDDEVAIYIALAKQISVALQNARRYHITETAEELFRTLADNAPVLIWMDNSEGRGTFYNKGWTEFTGRTQEQEMGLGWAEGLHPDDYHTCLGTYRKAFEAREKFSMDYRLKRFDGVYRWLADSGIPRYSSDGVFLGYIGTCIDITDRKHAEAALRESEARLRAIAEATPIPIIITTVDDGITRYGNPALAGMIGLPLEKLIGNPAVNSYNDPTEREKLVRDLKARHSLRNYEVLLKRADNTPFWVSLSSELITFNGEPCVLTGFYDIAERKRVEERERAITQGLRAVVEAADELLGYDDLDTIYRRAVELAREKLKVERCAIFLLDPAQEYLWGTYGTDIYGRTTDERWLRITAAAHTQKFNGSSLKWHTHLENEQTTTENGQLRVIGVGWAVTTVIRTTAGPLGVFINDAAISNSALDEATQDSVVIYCSLLGHIIERKMTEKTIQESLKEKEVLIKEVHHRVKNNMQVIVSMINLQSGYITDAKALEIFHDTQHRVRAMALVHEKLYQSNNLAQIDFRDYIEHLASSLFHSYSPHSSRVTLRVDIGNVALSVDSAIPCGLIVNELISNALKYAFPDNRQGELIVRLQEAAAGGIEMIVEDDGIGFPPEVDFRNTQSLGMQLVHSLAKQLGGTLDLDREHGTKFTLRFRRHTGR